MEGCRADPVLAVRHGCADLGLLDGPGDEEALDRSALCREPAMMAIPQGHPLATAKLTLSRDLTNETSLVTSVNLGLESQSLIRSCLAPSQRIDFREHNVSREGLFNLIGAGLGITVLAGSALALAIPAWSYLQLARIPHRQPTMCPPTGTRIATTRHCAASWR